MKVLITGGAGYLGSVLVGLLLDKKYKVTVVDNLIYKQQSLTSYCYNKDFTFIKGDVRRLTSLVNLKDFDIIIPLAAIVGMPACDSNPKLASDINLEQIVTIVKNTSKNQQLIIPNTKSLTRRSSLIRGDSPNTVASLKTTPDRVLSNTDSSARHFVFA